MSKAKGAWSANGRLLILLQRIRIMLAKNEVSGETFLLNHPVGSIATVSIIGEFLPPGATQQAFSVFLWELKISTKMSGKSEKKPRLEETPDDYYHERDKEIGIFTIICYTAKLPPGHSSMTKGTQVRSLRKGKGFPSSQDPDLGA